MDTVQMLITWGTAHVATLAIGGVVLGFAACVWTATSLALARCKGGM